MKKFKVGDFVKYKTPVNEEFGWVKSISDENHVFVVYKTKNSDYINETNYTQFTAARTCVDDLTLA